MDQKRVSHKIQKRFQYEESTKHTEKTGKIQQKVLFFENLLGIVLLCQLSRTSSGEYYFNDFIFFKKSNLQVKTMIFSEIFSILQK